MSNNDLGIMYEIRCVVNTALAAWEERDAAHAAYCLVLEHQRGTKLAKSDFMSCANIRGTSLASTFLLTYVVTYSPAFWPYFE